jgi:hypothetical protein
MSQSVHRPFTCISFIFLVALAVQMHNKFQMGGETDRYLASQLMAIIAPDRSSRSVGARDHLATSDRQALLLCDCVFAQSYIASFAFTQVLIIVSTIPELERLTWRISEPAPSPFEGIVSATFFQTGEIFVASKTGGVPAYNPYRFCFCGKLRDAFKTAPQLTPLPAVAPVPHSSATAIERSSSPTLPSSTQSAHAALMCVDQLHHPILIPVRDTAPAPPASPPPDWLPSLLPLNGSASSSSASASAVVSHSSPAVVSASAADNLSVSNVDSVPVHARPLSLTTIHPLPSARPSLIYDHDPFFVISSRPSAATLSPRGLPLRLWRLIRDLKMTFQKRRMYWEHTGLRPIARVDPVPGKSPVWYVWDNAKRRYVCNYKTTAPGDSACYKQYRQCVLARQKLDALEVKTSEHKKQLATLNRLVDWRYKLEFEQVPLYSLREINCGLVDALLSINVPFPYHAFPPLKTSLLYGEGVWLRQVVGVCLDRDNVYHTGSDRVLHHPGRASRIQKRKTTDLPGASRGLSFIDHTCFFVFSLHVCCVFAGKQGGGGGGWGVFCLFR